MLQHNIAEVAMLSQNKQMRGYVLPAHTPVTIIDSQQLTAYQVRYSIAVTNPKTGHAERYFNWVTQDELLTKLQEFDLLCNQLNLV